MSPQVIGISTTYKTRVATEKPCKERIGSVIGQIKDRRVFEKQLRKNSNRALNCVLILSTIILGMSTAAGLSDLLFGRTRGAILALLYGRDDQSFYTRQIAREVDASVGA